MRIMEKQNRGTKRALTDEGNKEPNKDLFEPPVKRSHKEKRFRSNSQDKETFERRLKNAEATENAKARPESEDSDSDDSDATVRNPKDDDEDFS